MVSNFLLSNPEERVKKQVKNIYDSYSHPWDILAELTQNSVDAIKEWEEEFPDKTRDHKIDIKLNRASKTLTITDTGIGFSPENLPGLLAPNATAKSGNSKTVGEKGVGVTFCIFCSNTFEIDTKSINGSYSANLYNARTWREKDDITEMPDIENEQKTLDTYDPLETGTTMELDDVSISSDTEWSVFELSAERIEYLLRTKTALGNTKHLFEDDEPEIQISLTIIEETGDDVTRDIDFEYYYPHLFWEDDEIVDLDEFESRDDIGRMSDEQKRQHLDGKVWKISGIKNRNHQQNIRYYAIFIPTSKAWEKIARQNQLIDEDGVPDLEPGINIATRGMPTGISVDPPEGGSSGYWPHVYMLIEYDGFRFDLGRKSIAGSTQGMLKSLAKKKFRMFVNWRTAIRAGSKSPKSKPAQVVRTQRQSRFDKMKRISDIKYHNISFQKTPDNQEAGVVAIFHELIGSGELDNYKGYRTGYNQDYDFWGKYEAAVTEIGEDLQPDFNGDNVIEQDVVIEAKYDAKGVIRDIEQERKYLADIDMIVCWTVDEEAFADSSVTIQPLSESEKFYVGSTHKAIPAGGNGLIGTQLYIMSLKEYIQKSMYE